MTQTFVSKVDSNQLLTQVMLIQLNSRNNINDNNMDKKCTYCVHKLYYCLSAAGSSSTQSMKAPCITLHRWAMPPTVTHNLPRHLLGYFATRDLLGRGVIRPHVITRERMAAERRTMRHSKALDETILKHPLNFPNEVRCQVKVRSKVKIGAFRLRVVETSKLSVLGQNLLRVLLEYRERHWLSKCLILSSVQGQDQVTKGHHT